MPTDDQRADFDDFGASRKPRTLTFAAANWLAFASLNLSFAWYIAKKVRGLMETESSVSDWLFPAAMTIVFFLLAIAFFAFSYSALFGRVRLMTVGIVCSWVFIIIFPPSMVAWLVWRRGNSIWSEDIYGMMLIGSVVVTPVLLGALLATFGRRELSARLDVRNRPSPIAHGLATDSPIFPESKTPG